MTEFMQVTVVYLKVRTIDSWPPGLAERGTASALSNMGPPCRVPSPLCWIMDPQLELQLQNQLQLLHTWMRLTRSFQI
jgi:hypothetical protein